MKTDDATAVGFVAVAIVELKSALENAEEVISRAVNPDDDFETPLAPAATDARRAAELLDRALAVVNEGSGVAVTATPPEHSFACSQGSLFWCSIHCPLDHKGPAGAADRNCGESDYLCSEHCTSSEGG